MFTFVFSLFIYSLLQLLVYAHLYMFALSSFNFTFFYISYTHISQVFRCYLSSNIRSSLYYLRCKWMLILLFLIHLFLYFRQICFLKATLRVHLLPVMIFDSALICSSAKFAGLLVRFVSFMRFFHIVIQAFHSSFHA